MKNEKYNLTNSVDVMELYSIMNNGATLEDIEEIKKIGIKIGHKDLLYRACRLIDGKIKKGELKEALRNAIGTRGYSIHEKETAVGSFYQELFRKDFDDKIVELNVQNQNGELRIMQMPYLVLSKEIKNAANMFILKQKGYLTEKLTDDGRIGIINNVIDPIVKDSYQRLNLRYTYTSA